jgi:hypothetical protein
LSSAANLAGWPWRNLYFGHSTQNVKTTLDGKKHAMTPAENDTSKFNRKEAVAAIAPNCVHGLASQLGMISMDSFPKNRRRKLTALSSR